MRIGTAPNVSSPPVRFRVIWGLLLFWISSSSTADVFRNYTLDSDPLWEMTDGSQWAFGVPQGSGGSLNGNPELQVVTRKPIVPGDVEIQRNPRARSARLRVAERTA